MLISFKFFSMLLYKNMAEVGCLKDGHFQNLEVGGLMTGNKINVKNIIGATNVLTEADSGCICTINVGSDVATTITLPAITSSNVGSHYEFFIGLENTGGIDILTASTSDTTGDNFVGAIEIAINATWAAGTVQDDGIFYLLAGADINKINMTGAEANGAGEVGSYVRCVAISYSSTAHSLWQVTGLLGTDDPDGTGAAIFVDRD